MTELELFMLIRCDCRPGTLDRTPPRFDLMPILADALMDAYCDSEAIIDHCRSGGPFVPSDWCLGLILT